MKDSIDGASASAKKLKSGLRGFDKLNVISTQSSGSSGGAGAGGGIDPKIQDAFNNAFKDAYGFTPSYDAGFNDMAKRDYIQVIVYGDFMDDDRAKENELQSNISAATSYINSAVASLGISSNTTVYDAVKKIDNYICSNFSYGRHCDVDDVSYRKEGNQNNLSRYAAICHGFNYGKLICSGYAEIFKEMCLSVGIDARILCGDSSEGNHAWNRVVFSDGTSRYIDSCWNDTTGSKNYLLLTYDAMSQDHWNGAE